MDYEKLGFLCGLEIHQQMDVGKLFCRCPSIVRDQNQPDITFFRKLRAVIGETGEIDPAAAFESAKGRTFAYEACSTSSCLVEYDEEPPLPANIEALKAALQVAQFLNMKIVDEVQFMRKTVVDGSNVSGFQRTGLIAVNGHLETSLGKVGIATLCLEEESAQKIKTEKDKVHYRLDRLGVSLLEIATAPDIKTPEHAKETAEKLGMILRSTGKAKRGIGSIRQDVNVSIRGGARTEIKGFQDLQSIPKVIEYEIERQRDLIKQKKKLVQEVRKAEPNLTTSFLRPIPGAARLYPETDVLPIKITAHLLKTEQVKLISETVSEAAKAYGLGEEIVKKLNKEGKLDLFAELAKGTLKASYIADLLLSAERQVKQEFGVEIHPSAEDWKALCAALENEEIAKENMLKILAENKPVREVLSKYSLMSDKELENALKKIIAENKGAPFNALIGKAMASLRGKAPGKKIADMLKKL